ncbi:T4SS efffector SepA family protein [Sneathiella sp.]|uniref:T4SS efffector SepA family protein n=1 Tax=Sneathiella sp. TaxID=1964365 RepID=UPI003565F6CE
MMPVIRINDPALRSLKNIAKWHDIDTPAQTIDRLIRNEMERLGFESEGAEERISGNKSNNDVLIFEKTPSLTFTRIRSAKVNNIIVEKPYWATVLIETIRNMKHKGYAGLDLINKLQIPAKFGEYEQEGYKFYPSLGISIQGQSASAAWQEISKIAEKYDIPVEVEFQWYDDIKAYYPGRIGKIAAGY